MIFAFRIRAKTKEELAVKEANVKAGEAFLNDLRVYNQFITLPEIARIMEQPQFNLPCYLRYGLGANSSHPLEFKITKRGDHMLIIEYEFDLDTLPV